MRSILPSMARHDASHAVCGNNTVIVISPCHHLDLTLPNQCIQRERNPFEPLPAPTIKKIMEIYSSSSLLAGITSPTIFISHRGKL